MDEALCQRVGKLFHERWGRLGLDGLLPEERDHVLLWELHAESTSGGLVQYVDNSSGDHAQEALAALDRHGLAGLAEIFRRTLAALPGGWCADRPQRMERVEAVENELDGFTEEYYQAIASEPSSGSLAETILTAYRREGLIAEPGSAPDSTAM